MSRSRPGRTKQSATRIAHHARRRLGILLGALAAASILIAEGARGLVLFLLGLGREIRDDLVDFLLCRHPGFSGLLVD